jgi:hypothetical protein
MVNKALRRLELRLPVNHPVWSCPPGKRAARIKEWIDLALKLEERLISLEEKLDALTAGGSAFQAPPPAKPEKQETKPQIDPAIFLGL